MRQRARAVLAVATLLGACQPAPASETAAPASTPAPPAALVAPAPPPTAARPAAPPAPVARVARLAGEVHAGVRPAEVPGVGTMLAAGSWLATGKESSLTLDLANGARITLEASTRALLAPGLAASVVLLHGALRSSLPGQGDPARAPLRIVTADASLQVQRGVDAWLHSAGLSTSYVAVLSGALQVQRVLPGLTQRELVSGQALMLAKGQLSQLPAKALALAAAQKRTLVKPARTPAASIVEARGAALDAAFTALEAQLVQARRAQRSTRSEQAAAHAAGNGARVKQLQAELVVHAQRMLELRQHLLVVFESLLALQGSVRESAQAQPRVVALAARYAQVLAAAELP